MPTNLNIDDALLSEAQKAGHFKTKRETVNEALKHFVLHRKQQRMLELEGKIVFEDGFDYKALRGRKPVDGDH